MLEKSYFYVLRKGETRQLTKSEREKFKRDGRVRRVYAIQHDLNAQYLAAFRELPTMAYKDKGTIFTSFRDQVSLTQLRAEEVVLVWQAGQVASDLVREELERVATDGDEVRRAILKRGGTFLSLPLCHSFSMQGTARHFSTNWTRR